MKNFIQKIFILSIACMMTEVLGQQYNTPPNYNISMFPKTPDAVAFSKFIDIPSGNYTGVANFSIPIYTIEIDGYKLPIEFNYSTGGIKVGEIASRVGLGWNLNTGITLNKQVIGTPDHLMTNRPVLPYPYTSFHPVGDRLEGNDVDLAFTIVGDQFADFPKDLKPDIYSYQLLNSQGKFIMDASGEFGIPIPFSQIKIDENYDITDEQGIKYDFDFFPNIVSYNTCVKRAYPNLGYPDPNFKITRIVFPNGKEIQYEYSDDNLVDAEYVTSLTEQMLIDKSNPNFQEDMSERKCFNYTQSTDKPLSKIIFPNGMIQFIFNKEIDPSSIRKDLPGEVYLEKIIVKDLNNIELKNFDLEYDFFHSPDNGGYNSEDYFEGIDERLKLIGVTENLSGSKYYLEYYESYMGKTLPHRLSNSQDYWGVFNGKMNFDTSIGTQKVTMMFSDSDHIRIFPEGNYEFEDARKRGANKNPDYNYSLLGNLHKIIYPTGGYTEINYENDDYIKSVESPVVEYISKSDEFSTTQNEQFLEFTINNPSFEFIVEFTGNNDDGTGFENEKNCRIRLWNENSPNNFLLNNKAYKKYHLYNKLSQGETYQLSITDNYDVTQDAYLNCNAELYWLEELVLDNSDVGKSGTLRVKSIKSMDDDSEEIVREFTYSDPASNYMKTSGINFGNQTFISLKTAEIPLGLSYATTRTVVNNPGWQTTTVNGKPIGYTYVQEKYSSSKNPSLTYKKEYHFDNGHNSNYNIYNGYSPINFEWPVEGLDLKRGLKSEELYFNENNDSIRKINYDYDFDVGFNDISSAQQDIFDELEYGVEIYLQSKSCMGIGCIFTFRHEPFPIPNYWIKNIKTTTTEYENNQPKMVTEQTSEYSPDYKHTFLSKSITENSLGETLTTEYEYPQDLLSGYEQSSLMQEMENRNMIAVPVKTVTKNNGTVTSEQRTLYDTYTGQNNTEMILPKFIYAKKGAGTTSADKKITYDKYDEQGNLQQYTLADGTPVSIIWGYNQQYPIAKVEGVIYTTISSQAGTLSGLSDSGTLTETSFEPLRNTSGALVTCYIYEPLVGVKTIIQPNGQKEVYEYDSSGRLAQVKDQDGNILKKIDYNYQH